MFDGSIVWRPTHEYIERSRLKEFMARHGLADYPELVRRSTTDLEWFWTAVMGELDIRFYEPYRTVLDTSRGPAWARWCVGGRLNIVHNCLDKRIGTADEGRVAVRWEGEEGTARDVTYGQLWRETNRCANALLTLGIVKGDRVGLFMPMCPELIAAFFAIIKIGGIVLPLFSGYGVDPVANRLADAEVSVLIAADGFWRRGQIIRMMPTALEAATRVASLQHVVVVNRLGTADAEAAQDPKSPGRPARHEWIDLMTVQADVCETVQTDAEDPLMILYTSGTTGKPKGAVHTHCGFPIKAAQDMLHVQDVSPSDSLYWVTDIGWMMAPWEIFGTTLIGASMVLYDGALDWPGPDRLWSLVERHGVSILGVSPTLVRTLMRHGEKPLRDHDLASLRILSSTGEPWDPESWRWLFETAGGSRLPIINYSGGTETSGGLLGGNVLTPLKPCSFAGPPPGIAADVVDEHGRSIRNHVGELVVRAPWIGMTRGFWKDARRYEETYWSRFPGVWVHGDWAVIDDDGLWYIVGRSDDTIKIAGKRIGPGEVESVLAEHPLILESAAIGVPHATKGQALACFCVLRAGHHGTPALSDEIKALVAQRLGKPLRPDIIEFVGDLPKTRNAKIMRRVIRAAYLHESPGDLSALENPQAVDEIARLKSRPS